MILLQTRIEEEEINLNKSILHLSKIDPNKSHNSSLCVHSIVRV